MSKEHNGNCAKKHFGWAAAILTIMGFALGGMGFLTMSTTEAATAKAEAVKVELKTLLEKRREVNETRFGSLERNEAAQTEQFKYIVKQLDSIERKLK